MWREDINAPPVFRSCGLYVRQGTGFQQRGHLLRVKHRTAIAWVDHEDGPCHAFKQLTPICLNDSGCIACSALRLLKRREKGYCHEAVRMSEHDQAQPWVVIRNWNMGVDPRIQQRPEKVTLTARVSPRLLHELFQGARIHGIS